MTTDDERRVGKEQTRACAAAERIGEWLKVATQVCGELGKGVGLLVGLLLALVVIVPIGLALSIPLVGLQVVELAARKVRSA